MIYIYVPTRSSDFILILSCMVFKLLLFELFHFVFIFINGELIPSPFVN